MPVCTSGSRELSHREAGLVGRGGGRGLPWGGGPWATSTHRIANEGREGFRLASTRTPCAFQGYPGRGMEDGCKRVDPEASEEARHEMHGPAKECDSRAESWG